MTKVKTKGLGVDTVYAYTIMANARRSKKAVLKGVPGRGCPYRIGTHKWSIWLTTFNNHEADNATLLIALLQAGVPCDERA